MILYPAPDKDSMLPWLSIDDSRETARNLVVVKQPIDEFYK
jgi:hypothetical protein